MKYVLALLADWANGIFAVLFAAAISDVDVLWWHFLVGILLSHLPDIDALPELVKHRRVSASRENEYKDHREGLHYPMVLLSLAGLSALAFGYWGMVAMLAMTLHFINDLYGTGWGIKLFWPFSNRHFKFLGRKVNRPKRMLIESGEWEKLPHPERRLRLVVSWSHAELPAYIERWGYDDWIEKTYFRLNWISCTEYLLAFTAVVLLLHALYS